MKAKNFCLIVFLILVMAVFFAACAKVGTLPDDPNLPKDKDVLVKYIRLPPVSYEVSDIVTLRWNYPNYVGQAGMGKIAEETYACGARIKTETKIGMLVEDWRKGPDTPIVRKRLFVDGHEFIFDGPIGGGIEFIYHNDGTIELTRY